MFKIFSEKIFNDNEVELILNQCSHFLSTDETSEKFSLQKIRKARYGHVKNFDILQKIITSKTSDIGITSLDEDEVNFIQYETGHFFEEHVDTLSDNSYRPFKTNESVIDEKSFLNEPRLYTMVIQLSKENDYEGGNLIIDGEYYPREKGTVIIFRSNIKHQVTEITSGKRIVFTNFLRKRHTNFFDKPSLF
jgi:predicted 2-oxoglutarate/Fe(II)-dependent dioxygenase YbiX